MYVSQFTPIDDSEVRIEPLERASRGSGADVSILFGRYGETNVGLRWVEVRALTLLLIDALADHAVELERLHALADQEMSDGQGFTS
jgi:hypothetical protein